MTQCFEKYFSQRMMPNGMIYKVYVIAAHQTSFSLENLPLTIMDDVSALVPDCSWQTGSKS